MHTATTLGNGQVLIVGGFGTGFSALASAEIYDPSKGTFVSSGNLRTPRGGHVAALLADGKVLVVGGQSPDLNGRDFVASAEIYDPSTGSFTPTGSMSSSGRVSSAVLLPDGRVFVSKDGANAEIYDPAAGTFSPTGAYGASTMQVDKATLLPNGLVLVVGCTPTCNFGAGATALFDPRTNAFRQTGSRLDWDSVSTTSLLADGTVLYVEGDDTQPDDAVEIYDPSSGEFSSVGAIQRIGMFSTATRLQDGSVLIAGGQVPGGNGTAVVERYVPSTRKLVPAARLVLGRHSDTATLLPDGSVLLAGGFYEWPHPTASAEIYK
jgi:WD40 repeat protein